MGNLYRLYEFNAGHWEQQRKSSTTGLHNQGKIIKLCKVPSHMAIKENEEADREASKTRNRCARDDHEYLIQTTT